MAKEATLQIRMDADLKEQVMQKVAGLSDDNLIFLNEMIDRFMKPGQVKETSSPQRIGIKEGKKCTLMGTILMR